MVPGPGPTAGRSDQAEPDSGSSGGAGGGVYWEVLGPTPLPLEETSDGAGPGASGRGHCPTWAAKGPLGAESSNGFRE